MPETWAVALSVVVLGGCVSVGGWIASRVSGHGERIASLRSEVTALGEKLERVERSLERLLSR